MNDTLLTGSFGVAIALITWFLAGYRERYTFRRELQREHIQKLESIYAKNIELLEMSMRLTVSLGNFQEIESDFSKNNALLRLLSTKEINDQMEKISAFMENWSSQHQKGAPKKVGDTDFVIIFSGDSKHSKAADELKPKLNDEILIVIGMMSTHLRELRKQ